MTLTFDIEHESHLTRSVRAIDAYRDARSDDCFALLSGRADLAARMLRARLHIRRGRPEQGLAALASSGDPSFPSAGVQGEFLLVRGILQLRTGHAAIAAATFDLAHDYATGAASPGLLAEFHHYDAARHFSSGDLDASRAVAHSALDVRERRIGKRDGYLVPLGLSRARALQTLGLIAAARGNYVEQLRLVRMAIAEAEAVATPDRWISAALYMNLAFLVRDFDLVDDAAKLRALEIDAWPEDLALMAFYIVRSLGWANALRGDHVGAFRDFKRSSEVAPTPALAVWASADRAFLGGELGDENFASDEIDRAIEIAERVDWESIVNDDRFALLHLARQLASIDPARARPILERYRRIETRLAPDLLNSLDRRNAAYERFTDGLIERHDGRLERARDVFLEVFAFWDSLGYRWLAATAAIELAELDAGERFAAYAASEAAERPNSWVARRVAAL